MYTLDINSDRHYTFTSSAGLELMIFGKPNEDGECSERTKYIANFWPEVISRVELKTNGTIIILAKFKLVFKEDPEDKEFTIPLQELNKICWSKIDMRCIPNPDVPKANEHIASIIRSKCFKATLEKMGNIDRLGTHIIEGVPVCNKGDRLTWPEGLANPPAVKWEPDLNFRLVVDPNCSEQEADAGMQRIIDLSHEAGRFIFSFNVLNVFREAFIISGVTPRSILFAHGFTGIKRQPFPTFHSPITTPINPWFNLPG